MRFTNAGPHGLSRTAPFVQPSFTAATNVCTLHYTELGAPHTPPLGWANGIAMSTGRSKKWSRTGRTLQVLFQCWWLAFLPHSFLWTNPDSAFHLPFIKWNQLSGFNFLTWPWMQRFVISGASFLLQSIKPIKRNSMIKGNMKPNQPCF